MRMKVQFTKSEESTLVQTYKESIFPFTGTENVSSEDGGLDEAAQVRVKSQFP
jgi:hypothetical protein